MRIVLFAVLLTALSLAGCMQSETPTASTSDERAATVKLGAASDDAVMQGSERDLSIDGYREWMLVNKEPYQAKPMTTTLCRPSPEELVEAQFPIHPHLGRMDDSQLHAGEDPFDPDTAWLKVYVSEHGEDAMRRTSEPRFSEGTIIVKEKWEHETGDAQPLLMTVMRKRQPGYSPDCGDWEFATFDGDGTTLTSQGRLASCMKCHNHQLETDFVFRTYASLEQDVPDFPLHLWPSEQQDDK